MMDDIRVPIYLVTGFLESGKTTFLDFTLQQEYFAIDGKTLLILCEEGEEEYDMDKLKLTNTVVEVIEDEEDLTPQRLAAMDIIHQPERVVIEYNGMWLVSKFEQMELPEGWGIEQEITCVDATTYQVYMANMKSLFMDMIRNTDMVVFNRWCICYRILITRNLSFICCIDICCVVFYNRSFCGIIRKCFSNRSFCSNC